MSADNPKLQAAFDYVGKLTRARVAPATIIDGLVANHGAAHRTRWDGSRLSCAGVVSTCTFSPDKGLLENWTKTASLRLMKLAIEQQA
ncbi:hypothetical protein [Sphingomonas sp. PAMC 26605]|uniref:hypothetical protein n=1 Tax=Sphingomonas sp. PAMC 26605 TaxID=1112214 RepID=UPI00026CAC32|nr:hypothetical protein [Sphingomonas sp. PAMC 26605]